ncbi:MAG: ATP-binding protein, partial [Chloroflexi bacterium]|nr:ATP-binding protein [Chloroflexota bacterium]
KNEYRNIAPETVINYIKACVDACLFYPAKRQDLVGKKVLQIDEKYYLVDHGIRQAVYGENERDIHLVLENIVYMELIRRGYKVSVGRIGDKEIDFVAQDGYQRLYVQVSYLMADEATFEREIRPLLLVQDNYPKLIIAMDPINRSTQGIQHFPIVEFLLRSGTL